MIASSTAKTGSVLLTVATCLFFVAALGAMSVSSPAPTAITDPLLVRPSLEGAWEMAEFHLTGPDTSFTITAPQPSLYVFLERHYSLMHVPGDQPRALFGGPEPTLGSVAPTDAEKVAAYDSFIGNAGTYEGNGGRLTLRPIVAKNPNLMAGGTLTYGYYFEGEVLWLTSEPAWEEGVSLRFKLRRLE